MSFGERSLRWFFALALLSGSALALFGCDKDKPAKPPEEKAAQPSLRIYAISGAAGAIEPCGCVKDMLGGVDHAAALIASGKESAPHALVVGAGPMFFADPVVEESRKAQSLFKAEAMAASLKDVGLAAWAPGANDFALGVGEFAKLTEVSGAKALAANLKADAGPVVSSQVVSVGDLRVGLVGISLPSYPGGKFAFEIGNATSALKKSAEEIASQGASIKVALISAQRGEALRLIEKVPDFQLAVIGKAFDQGEANDPEFAPEVIGTTLVVQAPNHLQGVSVVDLFVRGDPGPFADGSGLKAKEDRQRLSARASDMKARLKKWKEPNSDVSEKDIKEHEKELDALTKQLASLKDPAPPSKGSYFLYNLVEVREKLGEDGKVASRLVAYYRQVNEHNKKLFADRTPEPAPEGAASYVGVEVCSSCHLEERAVWDKSAHAGAYETLSTDHKEFNLDCVSCHVTGYEKPGGSTVTHVDKLTDVQCEVCHGPGSLHVENPVKREFIKGSPERGLCASSCHHPPHVKEGWSVDLAWPKILGPGHGR